MRVHDWLYESFVYSNSTIDALCVCVCVCVGVHMCVLMFVWRFDVCVVVDWGLGSLLVHLTTLFDDSY